MIQLHKIQWNQFHFTRLLNKVTEVVEESCIQSQNSEIYNVWLQMPVLPPLHVSYDSVKPFLKLRVETCCPDILSLITYFMSFICTTKELTYLGMSIICFNMHNVTNAPSNNSHFSSIRLPHSNYSTKSPISEIGVTCFERHLTYNNYRAIWHKRSSITRENCKVF